MTDLRKLSEAATPGEWSAVPNNVFWELKPANRRDADPYTVADFCASEPDKRDGGIQEANVRFVAALVSEFRSGALIPRSEYEHLLALLAEARGWIKEAEVGFETIARKHNLLSRIDDALAAEREARG